MTLDIRLLIEIIGAIALVLGAIQAYRKGVSENKSIETNTAESVVSMAEKTTEKYYTRLEECEKENSNLRSESMKWQAAFLHRGLEIKRSRQRLIDRGIQLRAGEFKSKLRLEDVSNSTYEATYSAYMDETNA